MARNVLALLTSATLASACASTPAPDPAAAKPQTPLHPGVPESQPDPDALSGLPRLWQGEVARAALKVTLADGDGAGNFDEVFGPLALAKPRNPYLTVEDQGGRPRLVERRPSPAGKKAMEEADKAYSDGKLDEALAGYRKVIESDPMWSKPFFYSAAVLKQRKDYEGADGWIERGLRLSPKDAFGYALRADMQMERGQESLARETLARALALDPYSPPALKVLEKLGVKTVPGVTPPITIVRSGKELTIRATHPAWRGYGACRALIVHDYRVRAEVLQGLSPGAQSPYEDTTCAALAVAIYREVRATGGAEDAALDRWSRAYDAGLLREAAIYDTLAARRPEILMLLDHPSLRMVDYTRLLIVPTRKN